MFIRNNKIIVLVSFLSVLSAIIFVLESFIQIPLPIPNFKFGFSNVFILLSIIILDFKKSIIITINKVILGSIFLGNIFSPSFMLSIIGGISALITMQILRKTNKFGIIGISLFGAFAHNLVQFLFAAVFIIKSYNIFSIFIYITIIGSISAITNAYIVSEVLKWMRKTNYQLS